VPPGKLCPNRHELRVQEHIVPDVGSPATLVVALVFVAAATGEDPYDWPISKGALEQQNLPIR